MNSARMVWVPAGTFNRTYRPTLLASWPTVVPGMLTWAPAMGSPDIPLITTPVTVPVAWAAADTVPRAIAARTMNV